ncbi:sugar ABC transporter ATP-binding protein [Candidatus Sumerlaeota bacterium]|nr:sugar ABC transporter ATP-binding protein [Candidatus Sumerlaeota bacterium]
MSNHTINKKTEPLARMRGIGKRFGTNWALRNVDFEIHPGETHALAGENGAGKSTLIKILAGVYPDFEGTIHINNKPFKPRSPLEAMDHGVAVIHQELSLAPSLSVADNIFLGKTITRWGGFVDYKIQKRKAMRLLERLGLNLDVNEPIDNLSIAMRQLVEIAKALGRDARIIVMDEPTSALNAPEVEKLFSLISDLKRQGCGIVYITHKMEEIEKIADRITVLRDGRLIGAAPASQLPIPELIKWMVGREMEQQFPRHGSHKGAESLRVDNFSVYPNGAGSKPAVDRVSFGVSSGEILGVGGLQGSGASELLMGIFGGYGSLTKGNIFFKNQKVILHQPRKAIDMGITLLTNDRKATGLVLSLSIIANATLAGIRRLSPGGWRSNKREREATKKITSAMNLQAASLDMLVNELSGGNQQKVVIAKWLQTKPKVLLLDEPTRGIDVGAKREIYHLMNEWTAQGMAIILITSEMPELLAMSDRIMVMHRGKITAHLTREEATAEIILEAAMGRQLPSFAKAMEGDQRR